MLRALYLCLVLVCLVQTASAHDVRSTVIHLDVGHTRVDAEVQMPVQELQGAFGLAPTWRGPIEDFATQEQLASYVQDHLRLSAADEPFAVALHDVGLREVGDGQSVVAHLTFTAPHDARSFRLHSDLIVHRVANHNTLVFLRRDALSGLTTPLMLGALHYQLTDLDVDRSQGSLWTATRTAFAMGLHHIAEGTDHLLFLLVLLLPACAGSRWWHIAKIVSAFTIGHSLTLAIGALDLTWLPEQPIEIAIAISILVSAIHAVRPVFAGYEAYVAGGFGLVHGLAFASTLQGYTIDGATLASTLVGFNLGIEAMQLAVVLMTMPWLIMLSRQPRLYAWARTAGALLASLAALGWIGQRAWDRDTPLSALADGITEHGIWCIAALAALAVLARLSLARHQRGGANFETHGTTSSYESLTAAKSSGQDPT